MKVLIVSTYFPPKASIASLRPYSFAKYWALKGHDVTVLAAKKYDFEPDLLLDCSGFKVIYAPLPKWHRFFVKESREIKKTGGKIEKEKFSFFRKIKKAFFSRSESFRNRTGVFKDQRMPSHLDAWFFSAYSAVRNESWDLVVSTFSPYVCHLVGYRLKKNGKAAFWIADYRDLWTGSHMFVGIPLVRTFEKMLERKINKAADCITAVSQPLVDDLRNKFSLKYVEVIENGFDLTDLESLPGDHFFQDDSINIVYTGNVYKGFRDPSPLFAVIKELKDTEDGHLLNGLKVLFVGKSDGGVLDIAKQYDVEWAVKHLGAVPRQQALHMQRDAHVLLFLESNRADAAGVLTGKLFEYLNSGTEVWGIGITHEVEAGRLIVESGVGAVFGVDQNQIKYALLDLIRNRKKKIVKGCSKLLRRYDREVLAEKMLLLVENPNVKKDCE